MKHNIYIYIHVDGSSHFKTSVTYKYRNEWNDSIGLHIAPWVLPSLTRPLYCFFLVSLLGVGSFKVYISPASPYVVGLINILQKRPRISSPAAWCNECESGARNLLWPKDANHSRNTHVTSLISTLALYKNMHQLYNICFTHTQRATINNTCMNEYHLQLWYLW